MKRYKSLFKESKFNYNRMLTPKLKKFMIDSIKAARYEGNDEVYIDTDQYISLFTDNLSPKEYSEFNVKEAEDFLFKELEKLKKIA